MAEPEPRPGEVPSSVPEVPEEEEHIPVDAGVGDDRAHDGGRRRLPHTMSIRDRLQPTSRTALLGRWHMMRAGARILHVSQSSPRGLSRVLSSHGVVDGHDEVRGRELNEQKVGEWHNQLLDSGFQQVRIPPYPTRTLLGAARLCRKVSWRLYHRWWRRTGRC
eukprot:COSAG01_NODE_13250_length_1612_cov_4.066094_1_plen_163_part_00